MTLESILIAGIGGVCTALGVVCKLLWQRSETCFKERGEQQARLEKLENAVGLSDGKLLAFERCPDDSCPFKRPPVRYANGVALGSEPGPLNRGGAAG